MRLVSAVRICFLQIVYIITALYGSVDHSPALPRVSVCSDSIRWPDDLRFQPPAEKSKEPEIEYSESEDEKLTSQ